MNILVWNFIKRLSELMENEEVGIETSRAREGFIQEKKLFNSHVTWFLCFTLSGLLFKQGDLPCSGYSLEPCQSESYHRTLLWLFCMKTLNYPFKVHQHGLFLDIYVE